MTLDRDSLTIIVPIHNEQDNLPELYSRLTATITDLSFRRVEVLLVSDGSTDRSDCMIAEIVERDRRFHGILLTRNFGHQAAVSVGLQHSTGTVVAIIDGDLQDPPSQIPRLIEALEAGADIAYGIRTNRKENWLKRSAYSTFYRLLRSVADVDIPLDSGDFCCLRREVVDAMLRLPERRRFVRGLRAWVGYRQVGVPYERSARYAGNPSYTWRKLFSLAYDGLFSFSSLPVRATQLLGFVISLLALSVATIYFVLFFVRPSAFPQGFATITISIWLLAGIQLFLLGVLGEYLVRTLDEVRCRPTALVRQIVSSDIHTKNDPFESLEDSVQELTQLVDSARRTPVPPKDSNVAPRAEV